MQTMGEDNLGWTPFCCPSSSSCTCATCPASSRSPRSRRRPEWLLPLFLAVVVWLTYNVVGFKHNGLSYLTGMLWPRNVPVAMRPLVGLIEFLSNIILRPFSLAVRLFANMLAGHMLLLTFAC